MSRSAISLQQGYLLHSCCLKNLEESGYLEEIIQTLPQVAVSQYVYGRMQSCISPRGLILLPVHVDLLGKVVDFAKMFDGDPEGYTATLALHHHLIVGMDMPNTIALFERHTPDISLVSTPAILKHWMEFAPPPAQQVAQAIKNISGREDWYPSRSDPLASWWKRYLDI